MDRTVIMLVEDNPDDEELSVRALRRHHLANKLVVARDGQEALDLLLGDGGLADRGELPQLVLLDLKLPKVSGLDVLRAIRNDTRTHVLPVVILTSSNEDMDLADGYELGANSYVHKPVDFDTFSEAVRQLGLYWLVINYPPPHAVPAA